MILRAIRTLALAILVLTPVGVYAQTPAPSAALLKPAQLDQLVAPIALYPDPLLAQVLMASTYPLDVVEAERWLQSNKSLRGDELKAAADKQDWDDSIKSLVATPEVLDMMSQKLDWTQKLGDAVVAQQADVMDAVQRLRAKAQANNKLSSTKQQTVTVTQSANNSQVIAITPTDPDTLYVPYYDPGVVYGDWLYPDYPPYDWGYPSYIGAGVIAGGIAFGAGYALGRWHSGGYWGGNVNWNNNNINIGRPGGGGSANWKPSVEHRQNAGNRGGRQNGGLNFKGNGGNQVINPGGNRGNAGANRPNAGANRPNAGGGGGNRANAGGGNARPKASTRPSGGGQRHHAANRGGNAQRARPSAGAVNRGGGGGARVAHRGGGGAAMHARGGGGGGMRGGGGGMRGGGGGGRGGGGRRSDIRLKHDIVLLGYLDDGLGFYRFSYNGSNRTYVGVIAQEVQQIAPQAVGRDGDGYLTVNYNKLGLPFESYSRWLRAGAHLPTTTRMLE